MSISVWGLRPVVGALGALVVCVAQAQTQMQMQMHTFSIPAGGLKEALDAYIAQSGVQLIYKMADVRDLPSKGVSGAMTNDAALARLLEGTPLATRNDSASGVVLYRRYASEDPPKDDDRTATSTDSGAQGGTPAHDSLQTVVVTGRVGVQKRTKAETSYSITTIDEEDLRNQGPTSVTESLKSVPGFWVESTGGEASGNVRARGVPVDGFGSINLLEDGMPIAHDPALGYLNADQDFRLDETISSIQVVRGGPSAIFYSNAPAGAVNYLPRQIGDRVEGLVKVEIGSNGLRRTDFWYGTPIADGWKGSFGGFYREGAGPRDPGYDGNHGGQVRGTLVKTWGDGKLSFDLKHLNDHVFFDTDVPMMTGANGSINAVPGFNGNYGSLAGPETKDVMLTTANGAFNFNNDIGTYVNRTQFTTKFEQSLAGDWKFSDGLRYNDTQTVRNGYFANSVQPGQSLLSTLQQQGVLAAYAGAGATGLQLSYVDSPSTVFNLNNQNGNAQTIEAGLRSLTIPVHEVMNDAHISGQVDWAGKHDLTVGLYLAKVSEDFDRFSSLVLTDVRSQARLLNVDAVNAAGQVVGQVTKNGVLSNGYEWAHSMGRQTSTALYVSDEWQVSQPLRIDAGLRWEKLSASGWNEIATPAKLNDGVLLDAVTGVETGSGQRSYFSKSASKPTWTLGANYQLSKTQGLFARYTNTFRLPNMSTWIGNTAAASANVGITQTMTLGEVGYKYVNDWTELYTTLFSTQYNNVGFTNTVYNPTTLAYTSQAGFGNTNTTGLELEGAFYPTDLLEIHYSATFQDAKYKNLTYQSLVGGALTPLDYGGNQLIRVPATSFRIVPGINLLENKLHMQMSYEFEGKRYVDIANTVVLPRYHTINASASYAIDRRQTLQLYVDNLNNSLGLTEGNPRAGEVSSTDANAPVFLARPLLGRAFRMSYMYKF